MARFYSNENVPRPVVDHLRQLGHDLLTSGEAGTANQAVPDREVLAFAVAQARVLLTLNRKHFVRLHRENPAHFGIMACTFDADFEGQAVRIHEAAGNEGGLKGKLVRVNRPAF